MTKYIVSVDGYDDESYEILEEALKAYKTFKSDLMVEGHDEGTQVTLYKMKPLKQATSVVDEERMKINTPKDEGHDWDYWAKWKEKNF